MIIQSTDFLVQSAISKFSLQFNAYLSFESFHCGIKCSINNLSINGIYTFSRLSHIHEALRYLNSSKVTLEKGKVLQQQKNAMSVTYVGDKKYTIETTVCAFEYFELSKAAYSCLRKHFELQVHVH